MPLSASRALSALSPSASCGTANSVSPSVSPAAPAVRAATISRSALPPCTTKRLAPVSRKPLPARSARIAVAAGRCLPPSSTAIAIVAAPATIRGYQRSRTAASAWASAVTPATAVDRNGDGVRVRPAASSTMPASTWPSPDPPCASGTSTPASPISPNRAHRSRDQPIGSSASRSARRCFGPSSASIGATMSCNMIWSSVRYKGIIVSAPSRGGCWSGTGRGRRFSRAASGCAWPRSPAGSRSCRPRSNWPWCAATSAPSPPSPIARCPIPARPRRPRPSPARIAAC